MQVFNLPERVTWEDKLRELVKTKKSLPIDEDKYHGIYRPRKRLEKELGIKIECKKVREGVYELSVK